MPKIETKESIQPKSLLINDEIEKFKCPVLDRETPYTKYRKNVRNHLEYPNTSMWRMIAETAKKYPNKIAIEYANWGEQITYKELMIKIEDCAKTFKSMGAEKGDKITIAMANTPEAVISFYAANMVGAVPCMIHPKSSEDFIKSTLKKTKSKFVVALNDCLKKVENSINSDAEIEASVKKVLCVSPKDSMTSKKWRTLYTLFKQPKIKYVKRTGKFINFSKAVEEHKNYKDEFIENVKGEDTAAIIFSGGTKNNPKAILHTNNSFNTLAVSAHEVSECLQPGDVAITAMPIFHGFGLEFGVHALLTIGMHVILIPEPNIKQIRDIFVERAPQFFIGVPKLFAKMLSSHLFDHVDFSCVKSILSGGSSLSNVLKSRFDGLLKKGGAKDTALLREGYGSAQTIAGTAINPLYRIKDGTIGCPLPDYYYKIVKQGTTEEVVQGEVGELCVFGPSVMKEYMDDKEATDEDFKMHKDGYKWLHTHDLVQEDEEGYYKWIQRADSMINTKEGFLVNPADIEAAFEESGIVKMSSVFGVNDGDANEQVVAYVTLKKNSDADRTMDQIYRQLIKRLAIYEMPKNIVLAKSLPETLVGKPDTKQLKATFTSNVLNSKVKVFRLTSKGYRNVA